MKPARPYQALSLRRFAALAAVLLLGAGGCHAEPRDLRTAEVEGRKVAYQILGHDRPALVLISGLGDGMDSFRAVTPDLAKSATVILYDRSGYGGSDAGPAPRDAAAADRELLGLHRASGVPGPYVIAGHSLGGLYAEYFAAHHPDLTAALILEESRPSDFTRRCEAAKIGLCAPPPLLARLMARPAQAEIAALDATTAEVAGLTPARTLPVLVLSRSLAPNPKPFDALWAQAQNDLAARYGAQHLTAPAGGHYVHKDQRDWFLARVTAFLATVSRSAPPTAGSRPGPGTR
jgi:pimeloyl-ACP methyl ester carboxylesterase